MCKPMTIALALAALVAAGAPRAEEAATLKVVASTPSLQSIVQAVGGDRVEAQAICRPDEDPHFIEVKPSHIMRIRKADLIVKVGMEMDLWMDALIEQAGNRRILIGKAGHVDASKGIPALEVPAVLDRAQGDVHPYGNPHYWLDPENGKRIAATVCEALSAIDPASAGDYEARRAAFGKRLDGAMAGWAKRLAPLKGSSILTYHRSWSHFTARFGITVPIELEPKPGIPPSAAHLEKVVAVCKAKGCLCLLCEVFHPEKPCRFVQEKAGIPVLRLHTEPAPDEGIPDYVAMFDRIVEALAKAGAP